MKKDGLKILLLFILLSAIQLTVIDLITIDNIAPQLLVIFVLYYSLKLKDSHSLLFGFLSGLFFDLISGGITGVYAFSFTLVSFVANKNKSKFEGKESHIYYFIWLVFISASISSFFTNFFYGINPNLFETALILGILPGIYTALFTFPILFLKPEFNFNG